MGVFADDVMENPSLIRWCKFTFCSHLCGYEVMKSCVQQHNVAFCKFASCPCLSGGATAEGWGKQTDGDRSSKKQYFMCQQLCVLPGESAAGDEFMRWQLPMKSPLAKPVMEKV